MMSSLFIGATGLKSHSEGMSVVTNNLANVNTVGFKQAMMQYQDLTSRFQTADSNYLTNMSQVGMGSRPGEVRTLFTDGGFESGSESTDMAITGIGFFGVQKGDLTHYTRAGNFRFTRQGELLDPNGWNLVGHAIVNGKEDSAVTPVKLDLTSTGFGSMAPKATSALTVCSQLGGITDTSRNDANPFFAMVSNWNGQQTPPIGNTHYSYGQPVQIYDSNGAMHTATVYYDYAGTSGGQTAMEYMVIMDNPSEDASSRAGTRGAGMLMAGTMTFSSNGQLQKVTAFTPPSSGDSQDLSAWTPAAVENGSPVFTAAYSGAAPQTISLDMGLTLGGSSSAGLASAADAAADPGVIFSADTSARLRPVASTAYGNSPSAIAVKSDGYGQGTLREITVSADGVMSGMYSNGQNQDLCRISLYRFTSQDGLYHEGNNHYSATKDSGAAQEGAPGTENFGSLSSYSLEGSNVDYAREFSNMIITQRGFQMNSKIITTSDAMLQKALELKR